MIFVILGTQKFQLNRLLRTLDEYAGNGVILDKIIAQVGSSDYKPTNFRCYDFLKKAEFELYVNDADIVICHGGVGSIMTALRKEKPVIIFPRLAKYNEHVDDHQTEIARVFSEKEYALLYDETIDLPQLIEKALVYRFNKYLSQTDNIVNLIEEFLTSSE